MIVVDKRQARDSAVEKIYSAAEKNFAQMGFTGARMDQIAKDAGVNKATIYYHTGGKQALYEEVLKRAFGALADQVSESTSNVIAAEDRLKAYINTIVTNICSSDSFSSIILHEVATGGAHITDAVVEQIQHTTGTLGSILSKGVLDTKFKLADAAIVHMMIIGCVNLYIAGTPIRERVSLGRIHKANKLSDTPEAMAEQIADIIINGIKTPKIILRKGR